jgi:hypothetical protein
MTDFLKTNIDFRKNFLRGAARLVIADMTTAVATKISDTIHTTTVGQANEVQTATINGAPTGGTFTLAFKGYSTTAIPYDAAAAAVQAALELLANIGSGGVAVTGSAGGPYTITFQNQLGYQSVTSLVANSASLTGGTTPSVAIAVTTPGTGIYETQADYQDLGATKGGITISRNNSEETFSVDQIKADILSLPNAWEMSVSASMAQVDIDMIQYLWEGGTISLDVSTGERTLPLGTPTAYRQKRLVVMFQRPSLDGGVTVGLIQAWVFRITQRSPTDSSVVFNREGDQSTVPFTWKTIADQTVTDEYARFGHILDQA